VTVWQIAKAVGALFGAISSVGLIAGISSAFRTKCRRFTTAAHPSLSRRAWKYPFVWALAGWPLALGVWHLWNIGDAPFAAFAWAALLVLIYGTQQPRSPDSVSHHGPVFLWRRKRHSGA
jgi:hypothetical protein